MSVEDGIPEEGQATQPHDWERDYKALQAEYTRSQQALKDQEGIWEDDETLAARLRETRPQWFEADEEEEPEEQEFDDPRDQRIAVLEQRLGRIEPWQQTVDQERGEQQFKRDLKDELGDQPIPENATAWIKDRTAALGNNRKALKQAVEDFAELEKELTSAHLERVTGSKKAQHVTPGGQPGTKVPNLDNRRDREAFLRQRAAELEAAQR